jgi:S-adenosylmethionine hydrolase
MMDKARATIALLTDFGTRDAYTGILKGVIASRAPEARIIDLTHEIPPGDVRSAALHLWQAHGFLPAGTIFLTVVDPGVGSSRRPIAVRLPNGYGVGPDNGLFTFLLAPDGAPEAVTLEVARLSAEPPSQTFHGRDVFAPAAARLAEGAALSDLGPPAGGLVVLPAPRLELSDRSAIGEVLKIDTFGNAVTSLGSLRLTGSRLELAPCWQPLASQAFDATVARVQIGSHLRLPLSRTFADVPPGQPLAYIGSSRLLEIGVNGGRADQLLGLSPGTQVTLVEEG